MIGMDDLVIWLSAQLDEDKRVALPVVRLPYTPKGDALSVDDDDRGYVTIVIPAARVLAEVDAKRRIIDEHHPIDPCDAHDAAYRTIACDTLRLLALPYADRPGYREEWRP